MTVIQLAVNFGKAVWHTKIVNRTFGHDLFPVCTFGQTILPKRFLLPVANSHFADSIGQTIMPVAAKLLVKSQQL